MQKRDSGTKEATSFRLSPDTKRLLALLADHMGISQASVLELLVRERARREKLTLTKGEED